MITIKNYTENQFPDLAEFINEHWKKTHPITDKRIFDWQYKGFGRNEGFLSKIIYDDEKIVGFRGTIPGLYQKPNNEIIKGAAGSVSIIHPNYRGLGIFKMVMSEIERSNDLLITLGANKQTLVPINLKNKFNLLDGLNRYIIPLAVNEYEEFLNARPSQNELVEWFNQINKNLSYVNSAVHSNASAEDLGEIWSHSTKSTKILSVYKNKEFWNWRYINNKGFKYYIFGGRGCGGVIVARIEKIISNKNFHLKILRLIELIPENPMSWEWNSDIKFQQLLLRVLKWAKEKNCFAADFQCSSTRLEKNLNEVGFVQQKNYEEPSIASLAGVFQPLIYRPTPINLMYKITTPESDLNEYNIDDTYFVKSDGDMDRPNIIGSYL